MARDGGAIMSKEKKQTPQQAFNQFLFESMMDKLRAVELYEKEVAGFSKQISQHITDHREHSRKMEEWMAECQKRVEGLDTAQGFLNKDRYELAERVKAVEQACRELRAHRINPEKVIADIKALEQNLAAHHERMNRHDTRISDLEETAESLSETVDQPSTCKCEAGNQMLKRIGELEEANAALWEGGTERDAGMLSLLKAIPDIEILKTQMNFCMKDLNGGMQPGDKISLNSRVMEIERNKADACTLSGKEGDRIRQRLLDLEKEIKDQREDYHAHIRQLVEENEAAHKSIELQGA